MENEAVASAMIDGWTAAVWDGVPFPSAYVRISVAAQAAVLTLRAADGEETSQAFAFDGGVANFRDVAREIITVARECGLIDNFSCTEIHSEKEP